jgi:hypothetical protein
MGAGVDGGGRGRGGAHACHCDILEAGTVGCGGWLGAA